MVKGKTASRLDKACVAVGKGDLDSRWHQYPASARGHHGGFSRQEVATRIARVGITGKIEIGIEQSDGNGDHVSRIPAYPPVLSQSE
jgi:hypothetical protein